MAAQRAVKSAEEEREWVAAACRGEPGAFRHLFDRHVEAVHAAAARIVGDGADADDVVQDTFIAAFRNLRKFRGQSALRTWLHRIAVNYALRRRASSRLPPETEASVADAERRAVARIDLGRALSALATLDEGKQIALVLHDVEGWTAAQIARSERRPLSTILSRLVRARRALARRFGHERKAR